MDLLELADRLWRGEVSVEDHHPFGFTAELAEVTPGTAFVASFANVSAFDTDEGLVLVDTGGPFLAPAVRKAVRTWSGRPVDTAVYSHGHVDHVAGASGWDAEAAEAGRPPPRVVGHDRVRARFERYQRTAGLNAAVNRRQFGVPGLAWPTEYGLRAR